MGAGTKKLIACFLTAILITACSVVDREAKQITALQITLLPYSTNTSVVTPKIDTLPITAPTATPEPVTYTVVSGDSLSVIALRFGVDLAALIQANPGINPNAMSVGTKLIIPSTFDQDSTQAAMLVGLPTPVIQSVEHVNCFRMGGGGWICFLLIQNDQSEAIENVSGRLRIPGSSADIPATNPLDIIPSSESIPLISIIPIDGFNPDQVEGRLVSAITVPMTDTRFGNITITTQDVIYDADRHQVEIKGEVLLPDGGTPRLVAYAVDAQNHVLGYRIWGGGSTASAGKTQTFYLYVYSLGGAISEIHLVAEVKLQ